MNHVLPEDQKNVARITISKKLSRVLNLPQPQEHNISTKQTWIAWVLLMLTLFNGATVPPFFIYADCNLLLKQAWRLLMTAFLMFPFAYNEYKTNPQMSKKYTTEHFLEKDQFIQISIASIGYALWTITLVISFDYTTIAHASILSNCQILIIVVWKLIRKYFL